MNEHRDTNVVILAGGLGSRLKVVVPDRPKSLAKVGDVVFLDILFDNLFKQGFRNVILSVGHMRDKMYKHVEESLFSRKMKIKFSEEKTPLGTGGAIKKALMLSESKTTLVFNGDTLFKIDYNIFLEQHIKSRADVSLALRFVEDARSCGTVTLGQKNKIISFQEKNTQVGDGLINGGIYIFEKDVLNNTDFAESFSIEKDFFEKQKNLSLYGFVFSDYFIDIGLPETYAKAQKDLRL